MNMLKQILKNRIDQLVANLNTEEIEKALNTAKAYINDSRHIKNKLCK